MSVTVIPLSPSQSFAYKHTQRLSVVWARPIPRLLTSSVRPCGKSQRTDRGGEGGRRGQEGKG